MKIGSIIEQFLLVTIFVVASSAANGQTTTATVSGHISDTQGLAVAGATVKLSSPNLQGTRMVTSSENGDYLVTLLPSGSYLLSVELSGFESQQRVITLAPTQTLLMNLTMGPAPVTETINVVESTADVLTRTAQVATNFRQDLLNPLPTNRSIESVLLLSPSVHPSGPSGALSISGAMSFESLFLIDGATVNENVRGQALPLVIEDAIQETTVAVSGISAEFGRFSGGLVNVVTKAGGNAFSGSFRNTLYNDRWRALTPFEQNTIASDPIHADTRIAKTVPTYEYTFGGPVVRDRLWFFTAGRLQNQTERRQTVAPLNQPYSAEDNTKRFDGKATHALNSNHSVQAAYSKIFENQVNATFNTATSMDLRSLYTVKIPQRLITLNYNGVLSPVFFLEGRFSSRDLSFIGRGARSTDLIEGTMLVDRARGNLRYWSPTQCGVCDPEDRNNNDVFVKGSYFVSSRSRGSHLMGLGYDTFNDKRFANNHQSGSDYRILGTTSIVQGATIYPQFLPGSTIVQANPIAIGSSGTHFRTHSLFFNDNWRATRGLTLNLGTRWDKNRGSNSASQLVADDSLWSPRLGIIWDLQGDGRWSMTASLARYAAAINSTLADVSSAAGNPATLQWLYLGPAINANPAASLVTADAAIQQVFDWFNAVGGTRQPPVAALVPGVSVKIPKSLRSPNAHEFAGGLTHQFASRATVRADVAYRTYHDFYSARIDQSTGSVVDPFGNRSDLAVIENTNLLKRRYVALTLSGNYRIGVRARIGGNYTLSRLWGNFDGENSNSGPAFADIQQYPEYRRASWYSPDGDLSADQRHRSNVWIDYAVPSVEGLRLNLLEQIATGVPYGALGQVDARPYVSVPSYATPQGAPVENYYYTGRDAFRTATSNRTDLAVNYSRDISTAASKFGFFVQWQLLNVFNQFQLCGCGADVFSNGGPVVVTRIGSSVLNATNSPSLERFNPLTATPTERANWTYGSNFGTPLNRYSYSSPRTLRISFGVHF